MIHDKLTRNNKNTDSSYGQIGIHEVAQIPKPTLRKISPTVTLIWHSDFLYEGNS